MDKENIISLKIGNQKERSKIYYDHRNAFLRFGKKFKMQDAELVDIYQEAFIALREHAIRGRLDNLKCSLKTYLFGIGKFMIYDQLNRQKKTVSGIDFDRFEISIEEISFEMDKESLTLEQELLRKHFRSLGKKCREVLTLFYSRGLTIDEIIEFTDYSSGGVVRSQKSRCIKTLRNLIQNG